MKKKEIGESLGFQSDKGLYKVLSGERELNFDALRRFREATGRSIDWLLTDEERELANEVVNQALTREGSKKLPDDNDFTDPHLQIDRLEQEAKDGSKSKEGFEDKIWVALLLVVEQNHRMLSLLERLLNK